MSRAAHHIKLPVGEALDREFLYYDSTWEDDNVPRTGKTLIALAEGTR
jgi:hypothetical protein